MRLLKPGTDNQKTNRSKAVRFIVEHIIDASDFDLDSGVVTTKDGSAVNKLFPSGVRVRKPAKYSWTPCSAK
jgi:hypothetical protein